MKKSLWVQLQEVKTEMRCREDSECEELLWKAVKQTESPLTLRRSTKRRIKARLREKWGNQWDYDKWTDFQLVLSKYRILGDSPIRPRTKDWLKDLDERDFVEREEDCLGYLLFQGPLKYDRRPSPYNFEVVVEGARPHGKLIRFGDEVVEHGERAGLFVERTVETTSQKLPFGPAHPKLVDELERQAANGVDGVRVCFDFPLPVWAKEGLNGLAALMLLFPDAFADLDAEEVYWAVYKNSEKMVSATQFRALLCFALELDIPVQKEAWLLAIDRVWNKEHQQTLLQSCTQ
jgi:hypothetical protein